MRTRNWRVAGLRLLLCCAFVASSSIAFAQETTISGVVVDAEEGPVRLGLAARIAADLGAERVTVAGLASASPARRDQAARELAALITAREVA